MPTGPNKKEISSVCEASGYQTLDEGHVSQHILGSRRGKTLDCGRPLPVVVVTKVSEKLVASFFRVGTTLSHVRQDHNTHVCIQLSKKSDVSFIPL
jgi:hypothetical protein